MLIKWTRRASQNFEAILVHIAQDDPSASRNFMYDAVLKITQLEKFPMLGRAGVVPQTRELVIHEILPDTKRNSRNLARTACTQKISIKLY